MSMLIQLIVTLLTYWYWCQHLDSGDQLVQADQELFWAADYQFRNLEKPNLPEINQDFICF